MLEQFDDKPLFGLEVSQSSLTNHRNLGAETYNFLNVNVLQRNQISVGKHIQYNSNPQTMNKHYYFKMQDSTSQDHFASEQRQSEERKLHNNIRVRQVVVQGKSAISTSLPKNSFTPIFTQPADYIQPHNVVIISKKRAIPAKQTNDILNDLQQYFKLGEFAEISQKRAMQNRIGQDFLRVIKIPKPTPTKDSSTNLVESPQKYYKSIPIKRAEDLQIQTPQAIIKPPINAQYSFTPSMNHKISGSFKVPKRVVNSLNVGVLSLQEVCESEQKRLTQPVVKIRFPSISAQSFVLLDGDTGRVIRKRKNKSQRQVASLTKIMTCYVALKLIEMLQLDPKEVYFIVPRIAARIKGTSANLKTDQVIRLYDVLFGMMLPSGNDAAILISEGMGMLLYFHQNDMHEKIKPGTFDLEREFEENKQNFVPAMVENTTDTKDSSPDVPIQRPRRHFTDYFIDEMNDQVDKLGLSKTYFACPHGLANKRNLSCAFDIAQLSMEAMKQPLFMKIVNTREHSYSVTKDEERFDLVWQNTNRLLEQGFDGIKTGNTDVAGPCLAASTVIQTKNQHDKRLVIVVIRSETQDQRFEDVIKIVNWAKRLFSQ